MLVPCIGLLLVLPGLRHAPDTPLTAAAHAGRTEEVQALLARGADANAPDRHGFPALTWAARQGHVTTLRALLDGGADVNARDRAVNGWTPLMHAIHKEQNQAALALLDHGADPSTRAGNDATALMLAAGQGNVEITRALLAHGVDLHSPASGGASALANAVAGGHAEVVRLLLATAPDLRLPDTFFGRASLWIARLRGRRDIVQLLEKPPASKP